MKFRPELRAQHGDLVINRNKTDGIDKADGRQPAENVAAKTDPAACDQHGYFPGSNRGDENSAAIPLLFQSLQ